MRKIKRSLFHKDYEQGYEILHYLRPDNKLHQGLNVEEFLFMIKRIRENPEIELDDALADAISEWSGK
jgi:hypothetical protein